MWPIKGVENKYGYLAERSPSLCPSICTLQFFNPFPLSSIFLSFFLYGTNCSCSSHHQLKEKFYTLLTQQEAPPHLNAVPCTATIPLGCKTTVWKLVLWVCACALCMFISNIWNKWHRLAETTQICLVNSQARRKVARRKSGPLDGRQWSACIIQLIL